MELESKLELNLDTKCRIPEGGGGESASLPLNPPLLLYNQKISVAFGLIHVTEKKNEILFSFESIFKFMHNFSQIYTFSFFS